jgi:hypothetical protein
MPRITEVQTDKTLYPIESAVLGHLSEFEFGTTRALVTGVEAAAIVLEATTGIKNFAVDSPYYYLKWMDRTEKRQMDMYLDAMIVQNENAAEAA